LPAAGVAPRLPRVTIASGPSFRRERGVTEQLGRRCALAILAALTLAACVGLLAWGPVLLDAGMHRYAGQRAWLGLPSAVNVLCNLPLLLAGVWGWHAARASAWPASVRLPWQGFFISVAGGSLIAAVYHAAPSDTGFVLAQAAMAAAFVMLTFGMLAERVHTRFGSRTGVQAAAALVALAAGAVVLGTGLRGSVDLRPFLLLQIVPLLLIPAGVASLQGAHTRGSDWLVMLVAYAAAKLFEMADTQIFAVTGWIGGHALMHLALAGVAARLAYRAASAASASAGDAATARPQTSLNTAS
jgi:putative effector of murein hydrolase LrgA (UPF0299 family)